jgi:biopolymer transport protein ExbD
MQVNGGAGLGLQSEINITPLVDVVLVLLIIFMVVVPLAMKGYDVESPQTSVQAVPTPADEVQVVLSIVPTACPMLEPQVGDGIPASCRVSLGEQEIPATDLPARVAAVMGGRPKDKRVLFLLADDRLNYEGVLRIVDLAKLNVNDMTIEIIAAN